MQHCPSVPKKLILVIKYLYTQIFKAIGAQAKQWANQDELQTVIDELRIFVELIEDGEEETTVADKDTEPELIVNHGYKEESGIRKIKFRVNCPEGF